MRHIDLIVIHCSDTPDEGDKFGFEEINKWHAQRGWLDKASGISCGYHAVIRTTGNVELGRPESSVGAHVAGHNSSSLGICLIGKERVTLAQLDAALELCSKWCKKYLITPDDVKGHYELFPGKTCPGQDMAVFRRLLEGRILTSAAFSI